MTLLEWLMTIFSVAALAVLGFFLGVTTIESRQALQVKDMEFYPVHSSDGESAKTGVAVVYFSRSGNTALAARHVAKRLDASIYSLDAPQYELGLSGLAQSAFDANAHRNDPARLPDVVPRTINLTSFDTVWLGAPVWFYSPAPPLWAFVEHNRFDGQHVVLFNTFNSNFGDDKVAAFKRKVLERGAISFEHRHVLRGRMTQQLTPEQMLEQIDSQWFGP